MQSTETIPQKDYVLVVDDTPPNLHLLITMLTRKGYDARGAADGELALANIDAELPDLVLLDINMPNLDGFEVCRRLKASDRTREIPVIFISARDEVLDKVQAFAVGAVDYITKPFQIAEVLARVDNQITLRKLQKQLQEQNELLKEEISHRILAEAMLQEANVQLERLVNLDGLTKLANRRCFDEYLEQEWQRLAREQLFLALIMCDIDFFKNYNDSYGHIVGDDCLKKVSALIQQSVRRPADLAARYGGEEFVVVLPNTDVAGAMAVAEIIRQKLRELAIPHQDSAVSQYVTLSMGVTSLIPKLDSNPSVLLTAADYALYRAKELGRNQTYQIG
ncbi:PleD family two-component system response regulator [Pseudanabaena sp. FACHB-1277]|jgi:diguanylate cyclase (GGDEF)-like protein|uniref:PleD family two-component system response regulator n=1 Tax=Pseudanabaena cinerea FACHB-1277 TaxID=2949581 RepID=A0A926UWT7_9CYAN|nr:PleD family two-component system response regulator [Pseudanabaena cinerea]MBD2152474.1 PleD family two-component system response regulator [Pseudanabaena cinerea FACHB-1277]